jgi:Fe-S-cluster containining protein
MPALSRDLEQLCSSCGLCCDGSLFTFVPVSPTEAGRLAGKLEFFTRKAGDQALRQPCAALENRCCQVYERRPLACRDFVCPLWKAVDEGDARLDEALAIVARAHSLIAEVAAAAPSLPTTGTLAAARAAPKSDLTDQAHTKLTTAERHLRFHFGWKG